MSQNNKDFDELNNLNITDDSLGLSDEMINAYMEANALETPDLWARIESGFEKEIQSLREDATVTISNASLYPPEQLVQQQAQVQQMPQSVQQTQVQQMPQPAQQSNVIDFQKRAARKKMIRNLAAVVILCVIAVPVMYIVSKNGDNHKSEDKYSETTAASAPESDAYDSAEESYDVKDEATGNSEIQNFAPSADETPSADDTTEGVSMMLTVDVTGTFVCEDDQLLFVIDESEGVVYESIQGGTVIVLMDSEETAATYFEKVDGTDSYGPFSVSIDIDTETMNEERPMGILLPNSSLKK